VKPQFTPSAREQFLAVIPYILRENPPAAHAFRRRAGRALRRLGRLPQSGRLIPEFPDLPYREVVVPPYRFFYRTEAETVWLVGVWHGAQLPEEPSE
jgi:plasmid stabilization system protein ParE